MRRLLAPLLPLLLAALCGCGGEAPLVYQGQTGQAVPLTLRSWVPELPVTLGGQGEVLSLVLDTGSPLTIVSTAALPGRAPGIHPTTLGALGLTFPDFPLALLPLFGGPQRCATPPPRGVLGGDLLRHFVLGLDYRARRAALFAGAPGPSWPPSAVGPVVSVPLTLAGAGELSLPGEGSGRASVADTWVLIAGVQVEGRAVTAVLDSGASFTLVRPSLLQALDGAGPPRRSLCCPALDLAEAAAPARLLRLSRVGVGGAEVSVLPAAVLGDDGLFDALGQAVGRRVDLVLGGSFLRRFALTLDYPARRLLLHPYSQQDHVPAAEFVRPGLALCPAASGAGMRILEVYQGTDAAKQGVSADELLLAVDGAPVTGLSAEALYGRWREAGAGSAVALSLQSGAAASSSRTVTVTVEELLP